MKTVKFENYEALYIHKAGNRTSGSYNTEFEAIRIFFNDPNKKNFKIVEKYTQ
jgi:hypothetical protein